MSKIFSIKVGDTFDSQGERVLDYLEDAYIAPYKEVSLDWDVIKQERNYLTIKASIYNREDKRIGTTIFTVEQKMKNTNELWTVTKVIQ